MRKLLLLPLLLASSQAYASEMVFQFKNPSFNGNGASSQWITTENQEHSRYQAMLDQIAANLKAQALADQNSILNRFMNNLQSRIYSQLAQQLTQNLFSGQNTAGTFDLNGNTISYEKTLDQINLTITDTNNNATQISIPLTGFTF